MLIIDKEGWLLTGDIAYFDEDRHRYIIDRSKEIIKYNGHQIAPADLESVLISHPEIHNVAVTGAMDRKLGEIPVAFVVRSNGSKLTEAAVIDHLAKQVAPYEKVRRVILHCRYPSLLPGRSSGGSLKIL